MAKPAVLSREGATTAAVYGGVFLALGAHGPFWPLWLAEWGLSAAEIGAYLAAATGMRIVAGLAAPMLADRLDARRLSFSVLAAFGAATMALHLWIESRPVLFAATLATVGVFAAVIPIADALGLGAARRHAFEYAHARSAGSAAFLCSNLACGVAIAAFGVDAALWWTAVGLAAAAWFCLDHPGGGSAAPRARASASEMGRLIRNPVFLIFVAATAFNQAAHAVVWVYGSLHWRAQGVSDGTIGALWAVGVAAEILLMVVAGPWLVRRLGPAGAIALACLAGVVRWSAMAADPGLVALFALQATHALTFAAGLLGAMAFLGAAAPERLSGTAQGFFGAVGGGTLTAAATALAALVYPVAGSGAYWIGAAMSAAGLCFAVLLMRRWRGEALAI